MDDPFNCAWRPLSEDDRRALNGQRFGRSCDRLVVKSQISLRFEHPPISRSWAIVDGQIYDVPRSCLTQSVPFWWSGVAVRVLLESHILVRFEQPPISRSSDVLAKFGAHHLTYRSTSFLGTTEVAGR